jgi:hypothetical protein
MPETGDGSEIPFGVIEHEGEEENVGRRTQIKLHTELRS